MFSVMCDFCNKYDNMVGANKYIMKGQENRKLNNYLILKN